MLGNVPFLLLCLQGGDPPIYWTCLPHQVSLHSTCPREGRGCAVHCCKNAVTQPAFYFWFLPLKSKLEISGSISLDDRHEEVKGNSLDPD